MSNGPIPITPIQAPYSRGYNPQDPIQLWGYTSDSLSKTKDAEKYIVRFPGDLSYPAEGPGNLQLPKSLFYEYTEGEVGASSGLFNYYVLGRSVPNTNLDPLTGTNSPLTYSGSEKFDSNGIISPEISRNPTAFNIISTTTTSGAYLDPSSDYIGQPYNPKDFIFCKDYGIIGNNHMITLRRFPTAVFDNLKVPISAAYPNLNPDGSIGQTNFTGLTKQEIAKKQVNVPICQAVTYFGEGTSNDLDSIIGFSTGLNWQPKTQETLKELKNNDPGFYNGFSKIFNAFLPTGVSDFISDASKVGGAFFQSENIEKIYARNIYDSLTKKNEAPLSERIFVDINTVNKMWVRGIGLSGGENDITLTFKYNLTSVSDINSKLLFLDLLANLLALGTDYGKFLTPQILEAPQTMGFSFPGGAEGYKKYTTDPVMWIADLIQKSHSEAFSAKAKEISKQITNMKSEFETFKQTGKIEKDGKLYKSLTLLLTENMLSNILYEPMMLSGYPTGDWHLVVGNPLNPIAMIGNLICKSVKIGFNSVLGPDDFPTEMYATYTLTHARQRHRGEFESMFNRGNGRLYLGEFVETAATTGQITVNSGKNADDFDVTNLRNSAVDANTIIR